MQTADFNHNDFAQTSEADKSLMVRFFEKSVHNKLESQKQNHPVFKDKIMIEIRVAGQRDAQACHPVTLADKNRFPLHWEAYEKRVAAPSEGMPLTEWTQVTRSQCEELAYLNIKTVEQLSSVNDSNITNFMGGHKLREQAIKWLTDSAQEMEDNERQTMLETIARQGEQIAMLLAAGGHVAEAAPESLASALDGDVIEPEVEIVEPSVVVEAAPAARAKRKARAKK
jgi:hypothetical protein